MAKGYLLDEAAIRKLAALVDAHDNQLRNLTTRRRRTTQGPWSTDSEAGFDRCRARITAGFAGNDPVVTVDNVTPTRGTSPTQQASDTLDVQNVHKLAGKPGAAGPAYVAIEFNENDDQWEIYQVEQQEITVVLDDRATVDEFDVTTFEHEKLDTWGQHNDDPEWSAWHTLSASGLDLTPVTEYPVNSVLGVNASLGAAVLTVTIDYKPYKFWTNAEGVVVLVEGFTPTSFSSTVPVTACP